MKAGFYPEREIAFKFRGAWWEPIMMVSKERPAAHREFYRIEGPKCLTEDCMSPLKFNSDGDKDAVCPVCERKYSFTDGIAELTNKATFRFKGWLTGSLKKESLDDPLRPLVSRDKDSNSWVTAKFGHTANGRKVVSILIGDRNEKDGEKLHAFVDLENENMRFDWKDKKPQEVVSEIIAYFPKTTHKLSRR